MMFEAVQKALAKQLRIDAAKITPEAKIMDDLGADSLDILQLLMTLEEDCNVHIPDEALENFVTVSDVVRYLDAHR